MTDAYGAQVRAQLAQAQRRVAEVQAERDLLRGMAERMPETHMQFGVIGSDGEVEMQPCADWCWACKLDAAKTRAELAEARIAAVRALAERGGIYYDGARRIIANQVLAALDGPAEKPATPTECPAYCGEGHMYDGGCLLGPLDGLPDTASISGPGTGENAGWAWRCWGTDSCDGWLSLNHSSAAAARRSYDRHVKREHAAGSPS